MKIIYLISSLDSKTYNKQAWSQKKTFASNSTQDFFFWVYASEYENLVMDNNKIFTPCSKHNDYIYMKTILAMQHILKVFQPDFIVRTNNSTFIHIKELRKQLASINDEDFILGFSNIRSLNDSEYDFVSGSFVVMPSLTAQKLVQNFSGVKKLHEDVQLSLEALKNGAIMISMDRCHINIGEPFSIKTHYRLKHSNTMVVILRMFFINKLVKLIGGNSKMFKLVNSVFLLVEAFFLMVDKNNDNNMKIISLLRILKKRT